MERITDYKIMEEYFGKSNKFDSGALERNYKMAGNIFAFVIRNNIKKILENTNYDVSLNNSFIDGIRNEWDLIIFKNGASDNGVNIYNQEDVKCVIELKTATFFKGNDWKFSKEDKDFNKTRYEKDIIDRFKVFEEALKPVSDHCRYLYVSLFQNPNHEAANSLKEVINGMEQNHNKKNSVFCFSVDTKYISPKGNETEKEKKEIIENFIATGEKYNNESFEEFILENIK